MNNISQISIFDYTEIENLGDLEKLKLFLDNVEDDELCKKLEEERANGRDDYPVRTMLNLIYAMKIFGHRGVESFRRELISSITSEVIFFFWTSRPRVILSKVFRHSNKWSFCSIYPVEKVQRDRGFC